MSERAEKSVPLDADVIDVLRRSVVKGDRLWLPDAVLARDLYTRVDRALTRMGGKWNRKERAHVFPVPVADAVAGAIESGRMFDRRATLQFFETPPAIADRLVAFVNPQPGEHVLEPSAGLGAIVRRIPLHAYVTAVEIDPLNAIALGESERFASAYARGELTCADFLAMALPNACDPPLLGWHGVAMNPPFTGGQDVDHVRHAFAMLRPGGRLAAVVSEGPFFRADARSVAFRAWITASKATVERLPDATFRQSGSNVATRIVYMDRAA